MSRTVGFLHTSPVHIAVFEDLVADIAPNARVVTAVDEQLLATARAAGPDTPDVATGVSAQIDRLVAGGAEAIVCTCSTIGGIAERVGAERNLDIVRVDRAMAERAVEIGGRVLVLAALESTLGPTTQLLSDVAAAADRTIELHLQTVPGAWDRFEAGDHDGYMHLVAGAIASGADDADVIVLAQASMASAADRVDIPIPVLSSPRLAVDALFSPPPAARPSSVGGGKAAQSGSSM